MRTFDVVMLIIVFSLSSSCQNKNSESVNEVSPKPTEVEMKKPDTNRQAEMSEDIDFAKEPIIDLSNVPLRKSIDGADLTALSIAYEAFKKEREIPESKKNLLTYRIDLHRSNDRFYVAFIPKSDDKDPNPLGGESEFGVGVTFIIDRKNYRLLRRYFWE